MTPLRFKSNATPCPVCGGYDKAERGTGTRCGGYESANKEFIFCTNQNFAGGLKRDSSGCYAHKAKGNCNCGVIHAPLNPMPAVKPTTPDYQIVEKYDYPDETGKVLFQVVRTEPKKFFQRHYDHTAKKWINNLDGVRRVIFNLPQVLKADKVIICEGEKDCVNLAKLGFTATTNPMGSGKWLPEYNQFLAGKTVYIIPDNDQPGEDHARQVKEQLTGIAKRVKIITLPDLPPKGDVSDFIKRSGATAKAELDKLTSPDRLFIHASELDKIPPPVFLFKRILLKNSLAMLFGASTIGKSFVTVDMACKISHYATVLYIAGEGLSGYRKRRDAWRKNFGAKEGELYFSKRTINFTNLEDLPNIIEEVRELKPDLIIIDTLARATVGLSENDTRDMGVFINTIDAIREEFNCCILIVHHSTKGGNEYRGSSALFGAMDTVIAAERQDDILKLSNPKQKDYKPFDPIYVRFVDVDLEEGENSQVVVSSDEEDFNNFVSSQDKPKGKALELLKALAEPLFNDNGATAAKLLDYLGWTTPSDKTVLYRMVNQLIKKGFIEQEKKGEPFKITGLGRTVI